MRGSQAKETRKKSALERLDIHLKNHRSNHKKDFENGRFDEKSWEIHDECQRKEAYNIVSKY